VSQFTTNMHLQKLTPGVSGHLPANDNFTMIDLVLGGGVIDAREDAPVSPADGDAYIAWEGIAATTAGNAFDGHANEVFVRISGRWVSFVPHHGLRIWNRSDNTTWVYGSSSWSVEKGTCTAGHNNAGTMTTTSATFAQMAVDTFDLEATNSIRNSGSGAGDVQCLTAGTYLLEWAGQIESAGNTSEVELAFTASGSQNNVTAATGTTRRETFANGAFKSVSISAVVTLTAGQYVAPLWRRISGSGTPTQTSNLQTFRVTKLNP